MEIIGSHKYGIVRKSQSALMMINPIIFTRTRTRAWAHLRPAVVDLRSLDAGWVHRHALARRDRLHAHLVLHEKPIRAPQHHPSSIISLLCIIGIISIIGIFIIIEGDKDEDEDDDIILIPILLPILLLVSTRTCRASRPGR
jgi:hypothetical protein